MYLLLRVSRVQRVRIRVLLEILREEPAMLLQNGRLSSSNRKPSVCSASSTVATRYTKIRRSATPALQDEDFRVWVAHDPGVLRLGND
ncbi:hypothetical protein VTN49DRAFT_5256 [Thermomyces lanuginosus]|uniref:uncharacterized protein n=1 Tax=Thermomyces lanuginosus TaxID=5541 RepID=UPI0037439B21